MEHHPHRKNVEKYLKLKTFLYVIHIIWTPLTYGILNFCNVRVLFTINKGKNQSANAQSPSFTTTILNASFVRPLWSSGE